MQFPGKQVLVTGASRGIGYAVAEAFVAEGASVTLLASSADVHTAAAGLADRYRRDVGALQVDITNVDEVHAQLQTLDSIDVLVNNAGLEYMTPIDDLGNECLEKYQRIININVLGTYYITRSALPKMPDGSRIVVTSSIWGKTAVAQFSAYCASKHANIGFMRSLAQELGPRRITVNAVCPGWVRTGAAMHSLKLMSEETGIPEDELLDEITGNQAIGSLLEPHEVAAPYLFLASPAAESITGQALNIDRGEVMA